MDGISRASKRARTDGSDGASTSAAPAPEQGQQSSSSSPAAAGQGALESLRPRRQAHALRPEAEASRPRQQAEALLRNEAAATIQAHWRGGEQRKVNALEAQRTTPYPNAMSYRMATHSFSAQALELPTGRRENDGWKSYASTQTVPPRSVALLHSFQREAELEAASQRLYGNAEPDGVIYSPYGESQHDMRVNSAWVLGLAHAGMPAVLTAKLDDETVVRRRARDIAPPEEQNTDFNLSALAREVIGMTGSGHYRVASRTMMGMQVLVPTATAAQAKLVDFKTPYGMPQGELKERLDEAGIDTRGLTDPRD
jgi:hypothetical protein